MKDKYHIIGLMSGTSLDGLDVVHCTFKATPPLFTINFCKSYAYTDEWKNRLFNADKLSARDFSLLDNDITSLFASIISDFIKAFSISSIDAISSHGHTVFHQPNLGYTVQVGSPSYLAAKTGLTVIGDYRTADIALGGQGAPLVPIGDRDIFSEYKNRINLGGFANISYEKDGRTIAYDVCPINMALNKLSAQLGFDYDDRGEIAKTGDVDKSLLAKLNSLDYFNQEGPKSLGKEWFDLEFYPLVEQSNATLKDKLRTVVEHSATQLSKVMIKGNCLVSGGGTHNKFLIERLSDLSENEIIKPDASIIDFKEALIFAYLGYLRLRGKNNILKSVTGASKDHCAGIIHLS